MNATTSRVLTVSATYLILWVGLGWLFSALETAPWISPWYSGHALSLGLIAVFGPRYMPLLFVARLLAGALLVSEPVATTLAAGIAVTASFGLAGWFLNTRRVDLRLGTMRAAVLFLAAGLAASLALPAMIGPVLAATGAIAPAALASRVVGCVIGDSLAVFGLAPIVLRGAAWSARHLQRNGGAKTDILGGRYGLAATLATVTIVAIVTGVQRWDSFGSAPVYLVAIPVIWAAFAFGSAGAALVLVAVNLGVPLVQYLVGTGLPVQDTQLLLAAVSVVGLLLGAATTELRHRAAELTAQRAALEESAAAMQRLCEVQSTLERAETIAGIGSYRSDQRTGEVWWSDQLYRMLRCDPETFRPSGAFFANLTHPDDRDALMRIVDRIKSGTQPAGPILNTLRMIRGDGVMRHLRLAREVAYGADSKISHVTGIVEDITDEIETRDALADTEARLSAVAANVPGMVFRYVRHVSGDAEFTYVSDGVRRLFGLEPNAVMRRADTLLDRIHPDDRAAFDGTMRESARAVSPWQAVVRIAGAEGELWVRGVAQTRRTPEGAVMWDGVLLDVTAEKCAERELERSEERFRFMTVLAPMALALIGHKDGQVRFANRACEKMFGFALGEMEGLRMSRLLSDADTARDIAREIDRSGSIMQREIAFRRQDGRHFSGLFSMMRAGTPDDEEIIACGLDVSELKDAQSTLAHQSRELEERVRELRCRYLMSRLTQDSEHSIDEICREIVGIVPQGWLQSERYWVRLNVRGRTYCAGTPDSRPSLGRAQIVAGTEHIGDIEVGTVAGSHVLPPPAEEERDILRSAARQIGTMIFEREASERLVQAQRLESIGQLSGGIAHDFNNLLTVIFGNLELAEDRGRDDVTLRKCLANAQQAAHRAAELTSQLLAFSRRQALSPEALELNGLIETIFGSFRNTLGELVEVTTELSAAPVRVRVDRAQMEAAILRLAVNARDAMAGGGRLTIATREIDVGSDKLAGREEVKPGRYVEIAISDTGEGMSPEILGRVFDPFFTTKEVGQGSGLGLSAVFGFVTQSGGFLSAASELGKGTTFRICLPVAAQTETVVLATTGCSGGPGVERGDACILVVEDEAQVLDYVARCLRIAGYRTLTATSAREALALLDGGCVPDLLLTDVGLPGEMNGPQLARAARERDPTLKLLYASGYVYDTLVASGAIGGGVPLILKPFVRHDLLARVRAVLDGDIPAEPDLENAAASA